MTFLSFDVVSPVSVSDKKTRLNNPASTKRCLDVNAGSFLRYGRQMDIKTTFCA